MQESKTDSTEQPKKDLDDMPPVLSETEPKWDYTTNEGTLFIGAVVVGLNLLVIVAFALYRLSPNFHSFITGKPL